MIFFEAKLEPGDTELHAKIVGSGFPHADKTDVDKGTTYCYSLRAGFGEVPTICHIMASIGRLRAQDIGELKNIPELREIGKRCRLLSDEIEALCSNEEESS